jgi:hypothetical protein
VLVLLVLAALVAAWFARWLLARRARARFCPPDECLTLALRLRPRGRLGWRHGFARLTGDAIEWRAEHKLGDGADLRIERAGLVLREHRPVARGEAMLSELCELVFGLYKGEEIQLGVLRTDLERFLDWAAG